MLLRIPGSRALRNRVPLSTIHTFGPSLCAFQHACWSSTEASSEVLGRIVFSGIQPTGVPHLGNYLGALRPWVKLQNEKNRKDQLFFSIVDLHALTIPQDPIQLNEWRFDTYISLLAVGLDPKICRIFFQSEVSYVLGNSIWLCLMLAGVGARPIDVDAQRPSFYRILVTNDPMEGIAASKLARQWLNNCTEQDELARRRHATRQQSEIFLEAGTLLLPSSSSSGYSAVQVRLKLVFALLDLSYDI